ncbi:hypothetical protein SCA6_000348 [Theobroma cacao]
MKQRVVCKERILLDNNVDEFEEAKGLFNEAALNCQVDSKDRPATFLEYFVGTKNRSGPVGAIAQKTKFSQAKFNYKDPLISASCGRFNVQ